MVETFNGRLKFGDNCKKRTAVRGGEGTNKMVGQNAGKSKRTKRVVSRVYSVFSSSDEAQSLVQNENNENGPWREINERIEHIEASYCRFYFVDGCISQSCFIYYL